MLDLDGREFDGKALADDEFVISADQKTSIQARCRCHPTLPPEHRLFSHISMNRRGRPLTSHK